MNTTVSTPPLQQTLQREVKVPQTPRPSSRWWIFCALALAAIVGLVVYVAQRTFEPSVSATGTPLATVTKGPLVRSFRIGGTVAALRYNNVAAPALRGQGGFQLTVVAVVPAGTRVKQGQVLAEFDRQTQINNFDDRKAEFISLTDQIAKRGAELDIEREKQQSELQKAQADVSSALLENKRNEIVSKIDAEKNQQLLAEAEATLKMLEQTLKLKRASADAEMKVLEIQRDRAKLQMDRAQYNFERLTVHAPIEGMVVLNPFWKGGQMGVVQEGDQVRPGAVFMQVVDPSSMIVRSRANQMDAAQLRPGMPIEVHLDAYPDLKWPGKVESVGAIAQALGWSPKVKTFPAMFSIQGNDPRLMPDISASVNVQLDETTESLLVPRGSVLPDASAKGPADSGRVWAKTAEGLRPKNVKLGPRNDTHWAVVSGLIEGETIAAVPPLEETVVQPKTK